jgi:hypothetical protein
MDITTVTAVLGSIKTATEIAKYIKDSDVSLEKAETKLKLAELISTLADAKLEAVGVQEALGEAQQQVRELKKQLETREKVKWDEPAYWLKAEAGLDGPYCQQCYDTTGKLVRLQGDGDGYYECRACKSSYVTKAYRDREKVASRQPIEYPRGGY